MKKIFRVGVVLSTITLVSFAVLPGRTARTAARPEPRVADSDACPLKTPRQWQSFLEKIADEPAWVETCEDSPCNEDYVAYVREEIDNTMRKCVRTIARDPKLVACTYNLRRFLPSWLRQHDSDSYGFNVPNIEYFRQQTTPDKPAGMMTPPPEIIAALPDRARVEAAARRIGLKYLTHDSALGGIRTFVLVSDPQGRYDQWMLLNLQTGKSKITADTPVSVLTVQKADADGTPLAKVKIHFRDYFVSHQADGKYQMDLKLDANGKCYSCHANGVRQLIARRTPMLEARPVAGELDIDGKPVPADAPDFGFRRLMEFNKRLRSYGGPNWDGKINPADHGPVLGRAQGCVDCHDGTSRGILTVSSSPAQMKQKMIDELSMPPDTDGPAMLERAQVGYPTKATKQELADLDRVFAAHSHLTDDFLRSRFPELKAWLLARSCR